ncbi:hypothetical protein [Pararhizobium sp. DWP1-1-3]|uniref:hypothetical protein n=1 Tax=Pararhizobium sp. DWP1-1-3 TaxID=2804652 RepID=UPI003CEF0921
MKKPFEHRKGYGLPEYLAYLSIKAAIRPLLRAKRYVAVIVRPPDAEPMAYLRAAVSVIDNGTRLRSSTAVGVFNPAKSKGSMIEIEDALQEDKVVLLFPDEACITSAARLAADVVVKLEQPTNEQMQRVFRLRYGARLTDAQAELFLGLNAESQRAIARPGKSVGRMLSQLATMSGEVDSPSVPPPSRPTNDEVEIDLESMSGYGAARDWGLQLKEDLKDWDANLIP